MSTPRPGAIASVLPGFGTELSALRRRLHQHAELGLQLPQTQADVLSDPGSALRTDCM